LITTAIESPPHVGGKAYFSFPQRKAEDIMTRKVRGNAGMSLVEATIILMVLAILTSVLAPSAMDYISDARSTKAKEDVEAIGLGVARLLRDVGGNCLKLVGTDPCDKDNRVDLLISGAGNNPKAVTAVAGSFSGGVMTNGTVNWLPTDAPTQQDTIEDQLIENDNATPYTAVNFTSNPLGSRGWRGAYMPDSGPDPWGFKYQVNTVFLGVVTDADAGSAEGERTGGWHKDVLVISPGPDGIVATSFASNGQNPVGDDVIFVIRGGTR
jgi:type II secretory pathway pseudopilin PulG